MREGRLPSAGVAHMPYRHRSAIAMGEGETKRGFAEFGMVVPNSLFLEQAFQLCKIYIAPTQGGDRARIPFGARFARQECRGGRGAGRFD
jgi:hypothetical protein